MTTAARDILMPAEWRDFWALTKPRVMSLVVFTALCGLLAAPGHIHPIIAFTAILCIALGAGACGALNQWYEADVDAKMARTSRRPLPAGRMDREAALHFGIDAVQEEVRLTRKGKHESLLVRMSARRSDDRLEGYVVAFDDVTDLVSAQRMAAWGDVARRIAHEIKNPLTPIQLSAERINRKFRSQVKEPEDLAQYTEVIVRQTNDLRRIVDEFSKFARMPEPDRRETDLVALLRAAVMLQENGQPNVKFRRQLAEGPILLELDATMIGQALTNLIKNAGEATETLIEKGEVTGVLPEIRISLAVEDGFAVVRIMDNGIGLPPDRARLFEPYVTTREKGTGLGLPIVKKIVEEHGGTLTLEDAPAFEDTLHFGAMAVIRLPLTPRKRSRATTVTS